MLGKKLWATTISCIMAGQLLVTPLASANTVNEVVNSIKGDSQYQSLVDKLTSTGHASEQDVESFVQDVVSQLDGQQVTKDNVNDLVKEAATSAISGNSNMLDAVLSSFSSNDINAIQNGQLPSSLRSLGDLFKRELLKESTAPEGVAGAVGPAVPGAESATIDVYGQVIKDGNKATIELSADKLKAIAKEKNCVIILEDKEIKQYKLTANNSEIASLKQSVAQLTIKVKGFAVNIPVNELVDGDICTLTLEDKASESRKSNYTALRPVVEQTIQINFNNQMSSYEVVFALPDNSAGQLANSIGIYRFNKEANEWEYVGGKADSTAGLIWAEINKSGTYTLMKYSKSFADTSTHWAKNDIEVMASARAVSGVSDSSFNPDSKVTRAEFASMIQKALKLEAIKGNGVVFKDISPDAWYAQSVFSAAQAGLIKGTGAEEFQPNRPITREEMTVILLRAMGDTALKNKTTAPFSDQDQISPWARESIYKAAYIGLTGGKGDNKFAPKDNSTRAEAVVMLKRLIEMQGKVN